MCGGSERPVQHAQPDGPRDSAALQITAGKRPPRRSAVPHLSATSGRLSLLRRRHPRQHAAAGVGGCRRSSSKPFGTTASTRREVRHWRRMTVAARASSAGLWWEPGQWRGRGDGGPRRIPSRHGQPAPPLPGFRNRAARPRAGRDLFLIAGPSGAGFAGRSFPGPAGKHLARPGRPVCGPARGGAR